MRSLVVVVLALAGCQCGSSTPLPPGPPTPTPPIVSAVNATTVVIRPGLELPVGPGTPPIKSVTIDDQSAKRLAALAYPGFTPEIRSATAMVFEVRHLTETRPKLAVTIAIKPCFDCLPMAADTWKQRSDALQLLVDERLRDRADTDFEIGKTELAGVPAIFTYQAGQFFGTDRNGNPIGTYTDAYALYYNDGINEIRVVAEYKDDPAPDKEAMVGQAPREQLDRIAHAFGDLYIHAW